MRLYKDHLRLDGSIVHTRVDQMKSQNLRPNYVENKIVPSSSKDHAYLVSKIEVLTKPFEDADVSADRVDIVVCSCPAYHFQESAGFENDDMSVTELGECKHITSAYKEKRAKADPDQTSL